MGKGWDRGVPGVEFWKETLRVAKPGAHLLAFGGTRTFHRLTVAIEDAGWEVRDCVMWLYGSGFPKSHNGPWGGTALKPAWEPVIVARKPLDGTVAANVLQYGTGALNIHPTVKPTALMRYLCRLVTPRNGVVLDPFCGSGSTGKAAILEGFHFVGIDLDSAHVAIAEARCQFAVDSVAEQAATVEARDSQLPLF
jgi:DNA modification methylase